MEKPPITDLVNSEFNPPLPRTVFLDTVSICNARCPFCPLFRGEDMMRRDIHPSGYMDPTLFDRILGELAALPERPRVIYFGYLGETLLDRHFASRIESIKRHDISYPMDILTNGSFLDEEKAYLIAEANIGKITIGFDAATRETYEKHRVRCDFDGVLGNIRRFAEIRNRIGSKTRIVIQYVRTRANAHETRAAYELFRSFLTPQQDYFQDNISKDWASTPLVRGDLVVMHAPAQRDRHGYCPRFASELIIHCDGKIGCCSWDYNLDVAGSLDDISQKPVLAVWSGSGRARVDAAMSAVSLSDKPAKCQECVFLFNPGDIPASEAAIDDAGLVYPNPYALVYHFGLTVGSPKLAVAASTT
jgi:sulfatase maturation enzyme AslB (radical SAM superfamily)